MHIKCAPQRLVDTYAGAYFLLVRVVDQVFDAASGSFGVRLELANPNGAIPAGVRCKARFL